MDRRGYVGFCQIVRACALEPKTADEVMAMTDWGARRGTLVRRLEALRTLGVLRRADWAERGVNVRGRSTPREPMYLFAEGEDAPPPHDATKKTARALLGPDVIAFSNVIRSLRDGQCTPHEMAEASGIHLTNLKRVLESLHQRLGQTLRSGVVKEVKLIYRFDYERHPRGGTPTVIWRLGNRGDKQRPSRRTKDELRANERDRQKEKRSREIPVSQREQPVAVMARLLTRLAANTPSFKSDVAA
jgi:hypothetical protein